MQIDSRFTFEKVRHDKDNNIHLVLDLIAPKAEFQAARPKLCIIPVLDRSSSMMGDKLHYAKQSLLKLVEHLSSDDYMGLVSFASDAKPDSPPERMTSSRKDQLKELIGRYSVGGNTNLSGGLLLALEMAKNVDLPESTLVRVILFTDGHPNHGVATSEGICQLLEKQMGRASVSSFGYGDDACQDLLSEVSAKGKGNYAYIKDPDAALSAFGKELGGLLSTYAQNIVIGIQPNGGHAVTEVLTDADVEEEVDGLVRIKIPHILSEETFNVVLSTKMVKQKTAGPRAVNAFDVTMSYQTLDGDGKFVDHRVESKAKIQFVKDGEEQDKPTREVDEIVARVQLVKAQIAAEEAAKRGDFKTAGAAMGAYGASAAVRGHASLAAVSARVGSLYSAPGVYTASAGRRRSLQQVATRGMSSSTPLNVEDQELISEAGYVVSNSSQVHFADAFSAGTGSSVTGATPSINTAGDSGSANPNFTFSLGGSSASASTSAHAPVQVKPTTAEPDPSSVKKSRSKRW